ncbi:indolepyruvate ferredoxin oxidoreductase subunit alpha [Alkaliphilus pronyensis]|uniref:indolepyruvate ferredoxin oxidoreductase subunit alpha n=1 Tax=Alkaliphilus pronyensis TaxID=1482732 RepID=UPI001FAA77DD|nr:4Fe-4S binding protein [Alkaliphilus pronyensis]
MDNQKAKKELKIIEDWCKGCGICVAFCPKNVLTMENDKVVISDLDKCIKCGLCELRCPDYAIYLEVV